MCGMKQLQFIEDMTLDRNIMASSGFPNPIYESVYPSSHHYVEPPTYPCYSFFHIRTCAGSNGARLIYDGCFLRKSKILCIESAVIIFDSQYKTSVKLNAVTRNAEICGNRTASQPHALNPVALQLLNDLSMATPRISGFFTVYGVAQSAETITESGCQDCLTVAYKNIEGCFA
ncbi:hypothetical protein T459_29270 [Capsicum annuum]|uniref:Gnk2-homologous domain-containing protein n=1 Tax=Capsicum annuum TaxID=4072 RepID=A0A2G2Y521_CAPAN|nr:hypothetical protein T459_29270 [Capsicum annuum]